MDISSVHYAYNACKHVRVDRLVEQRIEIIVAMNQAVVIR